jgi:hypothetical protein
MTQRRISMPIVVTTPIEVDLLFKKGGTFSVGEIFKLAQAIDEYEIEKKISATLVVDIERINFEGETSLLITPKENVSYKQLSDHLSGILTHVVQKEEFSSIDMEVSAVRFLTENPGMPSDVNKEVESIMRIKQDMITQNDEAKQSLNESRRILDRILKLQDNNSNGE